MKRPTYIDVDKTIVDLSQIQYIDYKDKYEMCISFYNGHKISISKHEYDKNMMIHPYMKNKILDKIKDALLNVTD